MQRESEAVGVRPAGRLPTQLHVNHDGRKPLFSKDQESSRVSLGGGANRSAMGDNSLLRRKSTNEFSFLSNRDGNTTVASPGGTRIPRPREEEAGDESDGGIDPNGPVDGSPSPAPRPWRIRTASDESKLRRILGEDHLDSKGQSRIQPTGHSSSSGTLVGSKGAPSAVSSARSPAVVNAQMAGKGIPRMKSMDTLTYAQSGDLRAAASPSRLGQLRSSRMSIPGSSIGLPDLVPGIDDAPLLSVERPSRIPSPVYPSPEKSFAWQVDEDFTAGDLQVSDSPRLKVGRHMFENRISYDDNGKINLSSASKPADSNSRNTKLDDIRSRELQTGSNLPLERPTPRTYISKLDQIRARESQVEQQIPIPNRHLDRLRNTKLDEIRQREENGLSRRALAAARLQEIKEMNQMARSKSPEEIARPRSSRGLYSRYNMDAVPGTNGLPARPNTAAAGEEPGRRIPDTPVTIFKKDPRRTNSDGVTNGIDYKENASDANVKREEEVPKPKSDEKRSDDFEWVRRLARAASSSPAAAETKTQRLPLSTDNNSNQNNQIITTTTNQIDAENSEPVALAYRRALDNDRKSVDLGAKDSERPKSTVAFAPSVPSHRARLSASSIKSKRSSMQSETDPTDRIEAEMKLFAPADNQSERGSLRAPSPPLDSEDDRDDDRQADDATPKPTKPDPLTMPTPRVTGAYVDTPVTVKVEKIKEEPVDVKPKVEEKPVKVEPPAGILRERRASLAWRNKDQDTVSEPGATEESDVGVTTSAAVKRPRAKSLPRRRPPVKNSAKPPSVRDDLLQLQRAYNVEDSTFDDLDEILSGRKPRLNGLPTEPLFQTNEEDDFEFDLDFKANPTTASPKRSPKKERMSSAEAEASDGDLATLDRMNKSLRTGIMSIRTAKQGIERLEGQFAQANKPSLESSPTAAPASSEIKHEHDLNHPDHDKNCPYCASNPKPTYLAYLHLAIPRLFYRKPQFRLTLLGTLVLLLSLWYAAESAMCSMYCRPTTCPASKAPCLWSYDDPSTFGTAIPIKLDQWATSGYGRELFGHFTEEASDWFADMQDLALGRDITEIDMAKLSFEEKRRHRRRLRKKGLAKPAPVPGPETKAKWDAWHQTRLAKQRAKEAREMGYVIEDESEGTSIGGDQRVW
ncbi:hypothetical protein PT974_02068 [Cladobotryum mycophilum]|uniref:Uncharacterized protein n=1 Tax=Cladobotryum mycophilum TaxID=491253 RepID=A0ABR0SX50_9HYPO